MVDYKDFFKDKKVTQLGLGLLGRGLNDAIFMLENDVADLIVTDKKTAEELALSVAKLKSREGNPPGTLTLRLGEHRLEDFENRDFILKGPGVPLDSEYIIYAKSNGIPIEMDSSLCVKLLPEGVVTVGVTGTRGKSTTTHLIAHILRQNIESVSLGGEPSQKEQKVFLGGNVRDMATLPLLSHIRSGDYLVLELDSWQLQGFGESCISPHISVFTTFMSDHMNYYKGDMDRYFEDKANIFKFQSENDFLIFGEGIDEVRFESKSKKQKASKDIVPKDWKPKIIGEHNLLNIACAIEACRALGVDEEVIKKGVESFGGVEGRLQLVREVGGVKIYNDNNATTPEATLAALASINDSRFKIQDSRIIHESCDMNRASNQNIVLICGGADKNVSLETVAEKINEVCKKVVLLKGTGSEKLKPLLKDFVEVDSLKEAVNTAYEFCEKGDNLLFSPMFASFGMFNNEYERNDQFLKLVNRF